MASITKRLDAGTRRITARLFLLVAAGLILASAVSGPGSGATAGSVPNANLQYGFVMALLQNNSTVRSMGFQWVSYTLGWDSSEPSPGAYDWGNANNIV